MKLKTMLDENEWEKSMGVGETEKQPPTQPKIEEADSDSSSAASDSPYNQPNATLKSVEDEAKKTWFQEMYLYLV